MDAVGVEGVGEGAGGEEVEGRVAGWGGAEDEDAAGGRGYGWFDYLVIAQGSYALTW